MNCIIQTHVSASDGAVALMRSTAALCSLHCSVLPGVEEEEEKTVCHRWVSGKEEIVGLPTQPDPFSHGAYSHTAWCVLIRSCLLISSICLIP